MAAWLLIWEHRLVKPDDFSQLDVAFFNMNGYHRRLGLRLLAAGGAGGLKRACYDISASHTYMLYMLQWRERLVRRNAENYDATISASL